MTTAESVAASNLEVADILRMLGTGATGPILLALGRLPLRTRCLTERVPQYAPRTIYRHAGRLADHHLVVRREEIGVPSVVTYRLSKQRGRDLFRLVSTYLSTTHEEAVDGTHHWTSIALLGEMWESGWVTRLSEEPHSPTELSELTLGMTFHQVNRRLHMLRARRLLDECAHGGRGKRYCLAAGSRRGMALVAGLGRWRERSGLVRQQCGLTVPEAATLLRASLPLLKLPDHPEGRVKLGLVGPMSNNGEAGSATLLVKVGRDGSLRPYDSEAPANAWMAGTIDIWLAALVDGNRGRMRVGGNLKLVDAVLGGIYEALWNS
jgi:DNA-binding HxlR family transcriptional regulator